MAVQQSRTTADMNAMNERAPRLDEVVRHLAELGVNVFKISDDLLEWQGVKEGRRTSVCVGTQQEHGLWSMRTFNDGGRSQPVDLYELGTGHAEADVAGFATFEQFSALDIAWCFLLLADQLSDSLVVPEELFRRSALLSEIQSARDAFYRKPITVGCEHLVISTCTHESGEWHCGRQLHYIQPTLFAIAEWREATAAVHRPVTIGTFGELQDFEAHVVHVRHLLDAAAEANDQQAQEAAEMAASKASYGQVFWDAFTGKTTGPMQGHRLYRNVRRRR